MPTKSSKINRSGEIGTEPVRWPQRMRHPGLQRASEKHYYPFQSGFIRGVAAEVET